MKMRRICNDKKPERKEDALNFVALHGAMGSEKDITKSEFHASCVSHTNSDVSHSDAKSDINVDLLAEYQTRVSKEEKESDPHSSQKKISEQAYNLKSTPSNPESSSKAEKRHTSTPVEKEPNAQTKLHSPKPAITRRNGCLFCGNHGHKVDFCYSRRHQIERAWRMNPCYVEPRRYGYVWIAKKDLYPKFTKGVSHEHTNVSYTRMVDQYTELEEPVRWRRRS
ncbi:hypothetical protein YC2023_016835 [Brassica napus]